MGERSQTDYHHTAGRDDHDPQTTPRKNHHDHDRGPDDDEYDYADYYHHHGPRCPGYPSR